MKVARSSIPYVYVQLILFKGIVNSKRLPAGKEILTQRLQGLAVQNCPLITFHRARAAKYSATSRKSRCMAVGKMNKFNLVAGVLSLNTKAIGC